MTTPNMVCVFMTVIGFTKLTRTYPHIFYQDMRHDINKMKWNRQRNFLKEEFCFGQYHVLLSTVKSL